MRTAPDLIATRQGGNLAKNPEHLSPSELLAQASIALAVSAVDLEQVFRQVQSDRDNLRHDRLTNRIVAIPPWQVDTVGGDYSIKADGR